MVSRNQLNVKALQSCRFRYYLVVTAAMTISAYHHGFQMFVFNNTEKLVINWLDNHTSIYFSNDFTLYSTTVAIFSAGGVVGSSLTFLANARFGSVKIIITCGFVECIGFLLSFACGFLQSVVCLIFGRFLSGVAIGLADGVAVLFLVEISPTITRGLVLTAFELTLVNGIVGSQIGGLPIVFGTNKRWFVMMFTSALGSIAPVVIMWFSPESPRYLLQKQDEEEAKKSLAWFRKTEFVDKEFEELKEEASLNREAPSEPLACRLLLCLKVVTTESACGFIILLYFSSTISENTNVKVLEPHYTTLVMGASLTFGTLLSLHLVDIIGRRKLLLISLQFISCITLFVIFFFYAARLKGKNGKLPDFAGVVYFVIIILISVVYGFGMGPSRWIAMVEHFNYRIRPVAVSITLPANFFVNFLIAQTFLIVKDQYKPLLFIPCAVWGSCSFWVIFSKLPETNLGKEELAKLDIYEDFVIEVTVNEPYKLTMTCKFILTVFAVCLGSAFHHGYHMGVSNLNHKVTLQWIKDVRPHKDKDGPLLLAVAVAMLPGGAALGSLLTNNKIGYKSMLLFAGLITLVSQLMLSLCKEASSVALLIMGRFLMGISVGICAGAAPIYISEISKESSRGRMITWFQVYITIAIWLSELLSAAKYFSLDKYIGLVVLGIVMPLIGTVFIKFIPESPSYVLIVEGNERKARVSLTWFRGSKKVEKTEKEFQEMKKARDALLYKKREPSVRNILRFPVFICLMIVISEQLCGISVLISCSSVMFGDVGLNDIPATASTLLMGFSMVFGVFVYLIFVEIVGRRILYLISIGSLFVITLILTVTVLIAVNDTTKKHSLKYVVFAFAQFFALMYGAGVGPSRWLIMVEPFNYNARPLVASLVLFCNFFISCFILLGFLILKEKARYYLFVLFTICDLAFFIFGYFFLTGKSAVETDDDSSDDDD